MHEKRLEIPVLVFVEPLKKHFAADAKERQKLSKGRGVKGPEIVPDLNQSIDARDKAAALVGINPHYVSDAKALF